MSWLRETAYGSFFSSGLSSLSFSFSLQGEALLASRKSFDRSQVVENLSHVRINGIRQTRKDNIEYHNQWFGPNVTVN